MKYAIALVIAVVTTISSLAFQEKGAPAKATVAAQTEVLGGFERRLLEGQSTRDLLAPAQNLLVLGIRKVAWAARSWQIEPALLTELNDAELFEFVSSRADALLVCSLEIYSKFSAGRVPDRADLNTRSLFWRDNAAAGPIRISTDCSELVDPNGEPIRLRNRSDFMSALSVQRAFDNGTRAKFFSNNIGKAPRVGENLAYLKREYGSPPQNEPEMQAALGLPVYSGMTATLQTFVADQKGRPVPFLVIPLSH